MTSILSYICRWAANENSKKHQSFNSTFLTILLLAMADQYQVNILFRNANVIDSTGDSGMGQTQLLNCQQVEVSTAVLQSAFIHLFFI